MKIVYLTNSLAQTRVLESFQETKGLEQVVLAPKTQISSGIIPEDYRDFGIKNIITYANVSEARTRIQKIAPDVVAQTTTGNITDISGKIKSCLDSNITSR